MKLYGFGPTRYMEFTVLGKMLELLKGMAPSITRAAALFNPTTGFYVPGYLRLFEASSPSLGIELAAAPVHDVSEIEDTIAKLGHEPGGGLIVPPEAVHRERHIRRNPAPLSRRATVSSSLVGTCLPPPLTFRTASRLSTRIVGTPMLSSVWRLGVSQGRRPKPKGAFRLWSPRTGLEY
jgi:hypothetical protein